VAKFNTYISMLRGINVSGQKSIKMVELKALCESLRFINVTTYIQSGNVVFQSTISDPDDVAAAIEKAIEKSFGFTVSVVVRQPADFEKVIRKRPSLGTGTFDEKRLYVTFLKSKSTPSFIKTLSSSNQKGTDSFKIAGSEIYIHCPTGYGKTVFSNTFFEKQLKTIATTRNWNTVQTLLALASQLDQADP
jgi:uncharacterized protein (DUF1697 family)